MIFMRRVFELVLFILPLSAAGCAQDKPPNDLSGKWFYAGTLEQTEKVECPDVIFLRTDGNYSILNDCYAKDIKDPVIEKGQWFFDYGGKLSFSNREFVGEYFFHGDSEELIATVERVTEKGITLCFNDRKKCIPEKYKAINQ